MNKLYLKYGLPLFRRHRGMLVAVDFYQLEIPTIYRRHHRRLSNTAR
ncbi:MAG: hypothetical protein MZU97_13990 [Bacillus subtilis]|nr:hypothetical protein [Bacillus subtilis]